MEIEGFIIPNHREIYSSSVEPLIPERSCELALECWQLKTENVKKNNEIEKLKSEILRLKFALKRSMETTQELLPQNKELNNRVYQINSELIKIQEELNEERSKTMLQSRVIESHKKSLLKIKESTEKYQLESEEMISLRYFNLIFNLFEFYFYF